MLRKTVFCTLLLSASLTQAADLIALYNQARQYDPVFVQAQAQYLNERETHPQALSRLLPNLSARASHIQTDTETRGPFSQISPNGSANSNELSLNLSQSLYNHGAWAGLKAAKAEVSSAEARFKAAEQQLILRLAEAYFDALASADSLRFAKAEQTAIERQLQDVSERFEVGSLAETDVKESRAAYDLAVAQAIEAENALMLAEEALYTITAVRTPLSPLDDGLPLIAPEPADVAYWEQKALEHNADLKAAEATHQARIAEVKAQRSGHYPNLELTASHVQSEQNGGSFDGTERDDTRVSINLNIPIYSGGSVNSAVRGASAQRDAARRQLDFQQRQSRQIARQAYFNVRSAVARAKALEQAVISNQSAIEATRAGFDAGTRTSTDILSAERELLRAQRNFARARYDYVLNTLRLAQAVGQLNNDQLQLINQFLQ